MKKIIFVAALVLGFSFSSVAQSEIQKSNDIEKQAKTADDVKADAKSDVKDLANTIQLDDATVQALFQLVEMKYAVLYNPEISAQQKSAMKSEIAMKIKATLTDAQMQQLKGNIVLSNKILN